MCALGYLLEGETIVVLSTSPEHLSSYILLMLQSPGFKLFHADLVGLSSTGRSRSQLAGTRLLRLKSARSLHGQDRKPPAGTRCRSSERALGAVIGWKIAKGHNNG